MLRGVERARRLAGGGKQFERAHQALAVVRLDGGGALRIDAGEFGVQRGAANGGEARLDAGAVFRVGGRQVVQSGVEGVVVEHGAADQQRDLAARVCGGDFTAGVGGEASGGVRFFRLKDVYQRVRVAGEGGGVRFGAADVHATVDLRGIDADEVNGVAVGEGEGERGFAGGGRADEADNGLHAGFSWIAGGYCRPRRCRPQIFNGLLRFLI